MRSFGNRLDEETREWVDRGIMEERWKSGVAGVVAVDGRCDSVLRGVRIGNETLRAE